MAKCGRRLHMEGVRLVSHLCSDLVCDPHSHQHNTDAAQPLQANHIADGNLGSTQGSLLHSSLASSNPQESHVQPGSPMVDDDAQNCPPCRNTVRAEVLDSKPEAIIGGKMDSMDLEPTRDSSTAMGSGMEGVQEEPSSQKGSAMDISTGRMSGQCSSVDAAVMPDQRASNSEEDFGISGKNPRQNGHHLPTIMEVPSGGVGHEENEQEQEAELCSAKDQVNPCFERDSEVECCSNCKYLLVCSLLCLQMHIEICFVAVLLHLVRHRRQIFHSIITLIEQICCDNIYRLLLYHT